MYFRILALLISIFQGLVLARLTAPIDQLRDIPSVMTLAALHTSIALFCITVVAMGMFIRNTTTLLRWFTTVGTCVFGIVVAFGGIQILLLVFKVHGQHAALIGIAVMAYAFAGAAYVASVRFQRARLSEMSGNPVSAMLTVRSRTLDIILLLIAPLIFDSGAIALRSLGDRLFHPITMMIAIVVVWGFAAELDEKLKPSAT